MDNHSPLRPQPRRACVAIAALTVIVAVLLGPGVGPVAARPVASACGATALSAAERAQIVAVSALPASGRVGGSELSTLRDHVARLWVITDILVRHHDRRGLFSVGLAVTERDAVLPLETGASSLQHPGWAQRISLDLLDRYLDAVHAEFTGGPVPAHWARYLALADECGISGQHAAMAGYNGHITVDLAYAVAASEATRADAHDFYLIVDTIAAHANSIISATRRNYGVDLGPAMRFYFLGEGLDRIVGAGRASGPMLRAADVGYNVLTFENGLALENPTTHPAAASSITTLWSTGDAAIAAADDVGVLTMP